MTVYVVVRVPTDFYYTIDVIGVFSTKVTALICARRSRCFYEIFEKNVSDSYKMIGR